MQLSALWGAVLGMAISAQPAAAGCLGGDYWDYYWAEGREGLYALLIPTVLEYLENGEEVPWDCIVAEYDALGMRFWVEIVREESSGRTAFRFNKRMLAPQYYTDPTAHIVGVQFAPFLVGDDGVSIISRGQTVWLRSE